MQYKPLTRSNMDLLEWHFILEKISIHEKKNWTDFPSFQKQLSTKFVDTTILYFQRPYKRC